ncbi:substrate-binding domain-containing protein [Polaromonas sp.]|uniref:substrate-binding domain-containing protein n=1 Tax=Polaromonas sp. TaxID=1869339 RepID=UPI001835BCB5|nr:substrate-binding domain-containing protein [Polaromonas sp.]NML85756.1 hypothetical protein [Polaromonas sp.]
MKLHTRSKFTIYRLVAALMALAIAPTAVLAQSMSLYTGSDTVQPVVEAALVRFVRGRATYKPQMHNVGTTPGFKEFCSGAALLAGASRLINSEESKSCAKSSIPVTEIPVGLDAVALAVSSKNVWLKDLTLAEITKIFDPASAGKITSWKQIRPSFPDTPIKAAGVGIKHATFGFFSESIGLKGFLRSDYKDLKDHTETAKYLAANDTALGFLPIGEAKAMEGQVRTVAVDFGAGPVMPGSDEISAGKYDKLSRTVYLYINTAALMKAPADDVAYVNSLVKDMDKFVSFANLVPLRTLQYQENAKRLAGSLK